MSQPYLIQWNLNDATAMNLFDPARFDRMIDKMFELLETHVEMAVSISVSLVPVKTGFLQSCIMVIERDRAGLFITAGVQGCEYGVYVEFGTSKMEARPFWRPAIWGEYFVFLVQAQMILEDYARGESFA